MNILNYLKSIDYIVIVLYFIILLSIGIIVSFFKKNKIKESLFLADRSLSWYSIGLNMWGTNVGPSMLIASASIGYTTGIVAGNFGWYAFVFIFLLAYVFAPKYLEAKVTTLPEFMGKKFGNKTRTYLAWYSIITILISWLTLTLFAGGVLIRQISGLPMSTSVIILVIISTFFTIAGGLKTIAYTNVFQMIFLIIVSALITLIGLNKVGGIMQLYNNTPSEYWNLFRPLNDSNYPWIAIILGYPVLGIWFWCTDQSMVQSVLAAKNIKQGQLGTNFTGWLKILDVFLFIIPGIICYVLYPNLKNPDEAYLTLVIKLLPQGMIGLVIATLIAALISTIDSALNSLSTVFTIDIIYKNKSVETHKIIKTGRIITLFGAIISIFLTIAIDNIQSLNLFDKFQAVLSFMAPPMSVIFLLGVLWKKTTSKAINLILIYGTLLSLFTGCLYLWIFPTQKYTFWPHFLLISFYLFIILSVTLIIISKLDRNGQVSEKILNTKIIFTYSKKALIKWIFLIVVMIILYFIFNGH